MRIATMNIQNLFHRDLSFLKQNASKNLQDWMEEFHVLLKNPKKEHQDLGRMRELAFLMGFSPQTTEPFLTLRRRGGHLYVKPLGGERQVKASERVGWNGWVELRSYPLDEKHREAKVSSIVQANPDILVLQEVEDRASLSDFNRDYLAPKLDGAFEQWLFTEGNDNRGLGHAILTRNGYRITGFQPHAHEKDKEGRDLFGMDCPEYTVVTPEGKELTIISARFQEDHKDLDLHTKRKQQAQRVRSFCNQLISQSRDKIMVCGTLGEVSYGDCLTPLLGDGTLSDFHGRSLGKTRKGKEGDWLAKHDYLLYSKAMASCINGSGVLFPLESKASDGGKCRFVGKNNRAVVPPLIWGEFDF